ncbi:MAG: hypothetical protein HYW81_02345 [Parcubacteria group bacterium]|nr:hypothetical protein [Parcubacteria group bacterium]
MQEKTYTVSVNGGEFVFSTGKLALQTNASVLARFGGTEVLATVVMPGEPREDVGYFPLMVDYEEKLYAAGKIKGSRFMKHEGKPTDEAILSARLVDRAVRPLFPKWLTNDVQVILTVLSFDRENDPDIVGLNAAAAALSISDVPWSGPIAGVRVARRGGEWVVNPTYASRNESELNLVVAGTAERTLMIESDCREASEELVFDGLLYAQKQLGSLIDLFSKMRQEIGLEKASEPADAAVLEDGSGIDPAKEAERFIAERASGALFEGWEGKALSRGNGCGTVY